MHSNDIISKEDDKDNQPSEIIGECPRDKVLFDESRLSDNESGSDKDTGEASGETTRTARCNRCFVTHMPAPNTRLCKYASKKRNKVW